MWSQKWRTFLVLASTIIALAAIIRVGFAENKAMVLPVDPHPLVAQTASGEQKFKIEIADNMSERSMGLMFRESMPSDQGMLFVFEQTQPVGFWMKNTILPLDLIFIGDDGKVKAIRKGEPFSEAPISPSAPVRFVLELNAGTAAARGIVDGDLMRHPRIDQIDEQAPGNAPG